MAKPTIEGKLGFYVHDTSTNPHEKWFHDGTDWIPYIPAVHDDWSFNGEFRPVATGSIQVGTTSADFKALFFASKSPTASIRAANTAVVNQFDTNTSSLPSSSGFGLYVIGSTIAVPNVEGNLTSGSNPVQPFTKLEFFRTNTLYSTVNAPAASTWVRELANSGVVTTNMTFKVKATDAGNRVSNEPSGAFIFTLPYFGTSSVITVMTPQTLRTSTSTYFQVNMVSETDTDKHKVDLPVLFGSLTSVYFYNTVSSTWEVLGGSVANSLALFTRSDVTHKMDIDSSTPAYNRYTHNGVKTGALNYRFYA